MYIINKSKLHAFNYKLICFIENSKSLFALCIEYLKNRMNLIQIGNLTIEKNIS